MAVILWWIEAYDIYACVIFILATVSIYSTLSENFASHERVREMARYTCKVNVKVGDKGELVEIDSGDLVPGDVIEIPEDRALHCDLVLLTG